MGRWGSMSSSTGTYTPLRGQAGCIDRRCPKLLKVSIGRKESISSPTARYLSLRERALMY